MEDRIVVRRLSAWVGAVRVVTDVDMVIPAYAVTAITGPAGSGKSTFIRCINRMHEVVPGTRVTGQVLVDGTDVYAPHVDPVAVRRRVGMVFQRARALPARSVFDQVADGLRPAGPIRRSLLEDAVEWALRHAALWDDVKDELGAPATAFSGGQQQQMCIAQALAARPEVLLLDEPGWALDPMATATIEQLIGDLKKQLTVVIVTPSPEQAARVADWTGIFRMGRIAQFGATADLLPAPGNTPTAPSSRSPAPAA